MIFHRTEPSWHYGVLRMISEEAHWELGFQLGATGLRLRMGRTGRPPKAIDLCLGHDSSIYAPVTLAVLERLQDVPEASSERDIDQVFPWAGARPDLSIHLESLLNNFNLESRAQP